MSFALLCSFVPVALLTILSECYPLLRGHIHAVVRDKQRKVFERLHRLKWFESFVSHITRHHSLARVTLFFVALVW